MMIVLFILAILFAVLYMNECYKVWVLMNEKKDHIDENIELTHANLKLSYQLENKKDLIEIQEKIIGDYEKKDN